MSGIFGLYHRSDPSRFKENFEAIKAAMSYWEPDDSGFWQEQTVGMGNLTSWNTPESIHDHQPGVYPFTAGKIVITADIRLDNRQELSKKLSAHPMLSNQEPGNVTDTQFVVASYREWGVEFPKHLLGDFSIAIWDSGIGELICVRDHLGVKPFYFHLRHDMFAFANDIRGLAGQAGISLNLDDKSIASYLAYLDLFDKERTFFSSIKKLPPATILRVSSNSAKQIRYWAPENAKAVSGSNIDDFAHELRSLLNDSVKARLRTSHPVTCHLSGGLDSSAITAIASKECVAQSKTLYSYNWAKPPENSEGICGEEWARAQIVARHLGIPHDNIDLNADDVSSFLKLCDVAALNCTDAIYENIFLHSRKRSDTRVILSGWGGDELITHSGHNRASDEFWRGKFIAAFRTINENQAVKNQSKSALMSGTFNELVRPVLQNISDHLPFTIAHQELDFLGCTQAEIQSIARKIRRSMPSLRRLNIRGEQLGFLRLGHLQTRMESWANLTRPFNVEHRYPLLDKRIVEFALGLPPYCFRDGGISRHLFRHTMCNLLPNKVAWGNPNQEPCRIETLMNFYEQHYLNLLRESDYWNAIPVGHSYIDIESARKLISQIDEGHVLSPIQRLLRSTTLRKSVNILNCSRSFQINS